MRIRRIQRGLAGCDIRLLRCQPLGPLEDFPECIQSKVDRDTNVGGDKIIHRPRAEYVKTVEEGDGGEEDEREPGSVGLEWRPEDESVAVDTLGLEGGVKFDVGDADRHPGEETGDGGQVLEPGEDS